MKISEYTRNKTDNNIKECEPFVFTCNLNEEEYFTADTSQNTTTIFRKYNQKALNIANNFKQRLFNRVKERSGFENDTSCFYVLNYDSCDQFEAQQFKNMLLQCFEKYKKVSVSAKTIMNYWVETVHEVLLFFKSVVNFFNYNLKKIEIGYRDKEKSIHNVFIQEMNQEDIYYLLWNIHNDIMVFLSTNLKFKNQLGFEFDSKIENVRESIYDIFNNNRLSMVKNMNLEEISNSLYEALQNATDLLDQTEKKNYISNAEVEKNIQINKDIKIIVSTESNLNHLTTIDGIKKHFSNNGHAFNIENNEINNSIGETQNSTDGTDLIANMSGTKFVIVLSLLTGTFIVLILVIVIIKLIKRIRKKRKNFSHKQTDSLLASNEIVVI